MITNTEEYSNKFEKKMLVEVVVQEKLPKNNFFSGCLFERMFTNPILIFPSN
jgi:hypothetical protein